LPPLPPAPPLSLVAPQPGGQVVETEALAVASRLVEAVAPGSDGACVLTAELVMRGLERFGPEHEEYRQVRAWWVGVGSVVRA
jgi:hypothetical protein